jgi:hypothetical protein
LNAAHFVHSRTVLEARSKYRANDPRGAEHPTSLRNGVAEDAREHRSNQAP